MTSIVQQKWELNRRKNEKARELRPYTLTQPRNQTPAVTLEKPAAVLAYEDGYLYLSDASVWDYPNRIWTMLEQLSEWLGAHHPAYWQALQKLQAQDEEAARQARVAKILGAIGNNLDDLPELKDEIIYLGKKLSRGEDIRSYCLYYDEREGSSSSS